MYVMCALSVYITANDVANVTAGKQDGKLPWKMHCKPFIFWVLHLLWWKIQWFKNLSDRLTEKSLKFLVWIVYVIRIQKYA